MMNFLMQKKEGQMSVYEFYNLVNKDKDLILQEKILFLKNQNINNNSSNKFKTKSYKIF